MLNGHFCKAAKPEGVHVVVPENFIVSGVFSIVIRETQQNGIVPLLKLFKNLLSRREFQVNSHAWITRILP